MQTQPPLRTRPADVTGLRFAYADPPYMGCCGSHYGHEHGDGRYPFDGGCWDDQATHAALVAHMVAQFPDGWALSCNPRDLRWLLPMCPDDVRVATWCKTWHQIRPTTTQYAWEPVLWRGGRIDPKRAPMVRDWMACPAARQRGLRGAKPDQFNRWVLDLLGFTGDDEVVDVFPGSDSMARTIAAPTFNTIAPPTPTTAVVPAPTLL